MEINEIKKLQDIQLEIMDEIHRICVENCLKYYLIGGSAIGAVRHKGLIPWDVDIDVGMPREDYIRFRQLCMQLPDSSLYEYHDWTNSKDYIPPHSLLCKKGTIVKTIYSNYNKRQREYGAFVDIIPIDNAPADKNELRIFEKKLRFVQKLKYRKICYFYNDFQNHKLEHIIKHIISKLMFFISINKLNGLEEKVMMKYFDCDTGYIGSLAGRYSFEKECKPSWMFGTPQLASFSGRKYYVPEHIHEFLNLQYGDYMKLPPLKEQQANLDYYTEIIV